MVMGSVMGSCYGDGVLLWVLQVLVIHTLLLMSLKHVHSQNHSTDTAGCEEEVVLSVRAGEALCVCVFSELCSDWLDIPDDPAYIWTRDGVTLTHTHTHSTLTHTHSHRVHTHGKALLFLPLMLNDSGVYYLHRLEMGRKVCEAEKNITVMDVPLGHGDLLFRTPPTQDASPSLECPDETSDLCDSGRGHITWYKDSQLLPGESGKIVRVLNAIKSDEGVYTCVCTWQHGTHTFNTSDSTRLELEKHSTLLQPKIIHPANGSTVTCQLGSGVQLECSGSCGSVTQHCNVSWGTHTHTGHTQHFSCEDKGSIRVYKAVLVISEVSHEDLHTHFRCTASNPAEWTSVTITLKQKESLLSVVHVCAGVLLFLLLVAMAVRWFAIDLALLFRSARRTEDGKVYDAYVVYPRECVCGDAMRECVCGDAMRECVCGDAMRECVCGDAMRECVCGDAMRECVCEDAMREVRECVCGDAMRECVCEDAMRECVCEDALSVFLNSSLPAVLEEQCGYKLFIHGRDDLPGEDQAEQVERCMRLSRRLLVVMTTVASGGAQVVAPPLEQFDWQMGLHRSLVQEDMSVIMVQVEEGHTHTHLHTHTLSHTRLHTHTPSHTHLHTHTLSQAQTAPSLHTHTLSHTHLLTHTLSQTQTAPSLQLLLKKSAPLRWEMGLRGANCPTSRFWKRVRYMMPPPPPTPPASDHQRLNTIQLI
ncbi:interleukin-1 receptor-like 1 [Alosa pseudoharengus]|uniref:interleukin-1 receptor-like 1 n=1 Tax=Alosa pseudoharengus TaxID=34774 RepID=UPI003F88BD9F